MPGESGSKLRENLRQQARLDGADGSDQFAEKRAIVLQELDCRTIQEDQ